MEPREILRRMNDQVQSIGQSMPERLDIARRNAGQRNMQRILSERDAERLCLSAVPNYPSPIELDERRRPARFLELGDSNDPTPSDVGCYLMNILDNPQTTRDRIVTVVYREMLNSLDTCPERDEGELLTYRFHKGEITEQNLRSGITEITRRFDNRKCRESPYWRRVIPLT